MCVNLFRTPDMPEPMRQPPPIQPRVDTEESLPKAQEVVDKDAPKAEVKYGSKKDSTAAGGKKTGTSALRIDVNTGAGTSGAGGSGLNV